MQARRWLENQLRGTERANLDAALLTDRGARYVASRVGWMGARSLLRTGLHIVEFTVLTSDMPFEFLAPLFAIRSLPALLTGVHWGALETLRGRVRDELRRGRSELARIQIESWLAWTGLVCAGLLCGVAAFIWQQPEVEAGPLGLYGAFAIVCAFATTTDLWTRTYHAGIFALGRVYRPVWTFFAAELLEITVLVQSHTRLGPFALHAAILLGCIVRTLIAFVYARRGYQSRQLPLPRLFRARALSHLSLAGLISSAKHAIATLPLQFDRMLLIALLQAPVATPEALPLAAPYYALRPFAAFAQSWARGFYPDLVRLDVSAVGLLRARFEHLLRRTALVAGTLSAVALGVGSSLMFGATGLLAALWLVPLSVVRSQLALEQVRGFAYGALPAMMRMGAALLAGVWLASYLRLSDRLMLVAVVVLLIGARVAAGSIASQAAERRTSKAQRLPLSAWLADLSAQTQPVRIAIGMVDTSLTSTGAWIRALSGVLTKGRVARAGRAWVLWWEPLHAAKTRAEWARLSAGTLRNLELIAGETGANVLAEARRRGLLPGELAQALSQTRATAAHAELTGAASALVPEARVIDLTCANPLLAQLRARDLAMVRRAILAAAREQHYVPRSAPWHVAVYAPGGEVELVFVWPRGAAHGWQLARLTRQASWRDSMTA